MKISCAALLEKSYFNYLLGCKERAAACASRFWAPGLTEGVAGCTFALKIPTWGSVALAVIGNVRENMKTEVGVTTGPIAVARARSMRRTPP